jgi:alpha-tubulin suppressor-like RCC1 family protein
VVVRLGARTILEVRGVDGWGAVAAGNDHTCAITEADGALWCWGAGNIGETGTGTPVPEIEPSMTEGPSSGWQVIAAGGDHTCGIASGHLYCWGGNTFDQLGLASDEDGELTPMEVDGEASWTAIAGGFAHSCGIRSEGRLFCWGSNSEGKLGVGDMNPRDVPTEVDVGGMTWRSVATGLSHTCGIRTDGSLWCWGHNGSGQVGVDGQGAYDVPARVDDGPWRMVATGFSTSCGVTEDDELFCWGDDGLGQRGDWLGDGDFPLAEVGSGESWASVAIGAMGQHFCARTTGGDFRCWGEAGNGQIGDGVLVDQHEPTLVPGGSGWTRIAAGGDHTCGVRNGDLHCWGGEYLRQPLMQTSPVMLGSATGWIEVAVGRQHGCAVDGTNHLWCWGDGTDGELGTGDTQYQEEPVAVEATREWLDVTVGGDHTCAVEQLTGGATAGPVWCWGRNDDAQIRDPLMGASLEPIETINPADFDEVSAGLNHTCAHRNGDNEIHCWGNNAESQSSGTTNPQWPPVAVPNAGWASVGAGDHHTCGILVGDVHCWGDDDSGQLGDGTASGNSSTPVMAAHTGDWTVVAGGGYHACAIEVTAPAPRELWCWGENDDGELGVPAADGWRQPTRIGETIDWVTVSAGVSHTCGIDAAAQLYCWGENNLGQLGLGESNRYEPTPVAPAQEL